MAWPRIDGLRTLELGTPGELRQRLNGLVLVGDEGAALAVVEVDRVEIMPFGDVPWEFAAAEAEGDSSIEEWRDGHRRYFKSAAGVDIGDDEPMVLSWLHLVPNPGD
jgi:uncharacterized protein YhfF